MFYIQCNNYYLLQKECQDNIVKQFKDRLLQSILLQYARNKRFNSKQTGQSSFLWNANLVGVCGGYLGRCELFQQTWKNFQVCRPNCRPHFFLSFIKTQVSMADSATLLQKDSRADCPGALRDIILFSYPESPSEFVSRLSRLCCRVQDSLPACC